MNDEPTVHEEPTPPAPGGDDPARRLDELLRSHFDEPDETGVAARRPIDDDASERDRDETASNNETRVTAASTGDAPRITSTHSRSIPNSTAYGSRRS